MSEKVTEAHFSNVSSLLVLNWCKYFVTKCLKNQTRKCLNKIKSLYAELL